MFNKRIIKVFARGESRALEGRSVSSKALQGSEIELRKLLGGTKETRKFSTKRKAKEMS